MKSKAYSKVTLVAVAIIFIITTVLGLNIFLPSFAASTDTKASTLKFKQIEAGADFAIALTYGGDIYAWSLRDDAGDKIIKDSSTVLSGTEGAQSTLNSKTLGQYYSKTPTRIEVNYRKEGDNIIARDAAVAGSDDTKIKKIATTRTTAAFITESGTVYTWGLDERDELAHSGNAIYYKGLLYRNLSVVTGSYVPHNTYYEPWPVNYKSYTYNGLANTAFPNGVSLPIDGGVSDISGSEDNYVVKVNNSNNFVVWGSSFYKQIAGNDVSGDNKLFKINAYTASDINSMIAGSGYVVGVKNDGLYFQGKNYYLREDSEYTAGTKINLKQMSMPIASDAANTYDGYINLGSELLAEKLGVKALTKIDGSSAPKAATPANFYGSDSNSEVKATSTERSNIALGTGFGYAINSSGTVLFWGSNNIGQKGDGTINSSKAPVTSAVTSTGITGSVQVVAGKIPLEASSVKPGTANNSDPENYKNAMSTASGRVAKIGEITSGTEYSLNGPGGGITGDKKFYSENGSTQFISASLSNAGVVTAWANGVAATTVSIDRLNTNNKIVYLSAGYGNNLFALTSLGKIYHIRYDNGFVSSVIDTFRGTDQENLDNWATNDISIEFKDGYSGVALNSRGIKITPKFTYAGSSAESDFTVPGGMTNYTSTPSDKIISNGTSLSGDAYRLLVPYARTQDNKGDVTYSNTGPLATYYNDASVIFTNGIPLSEENLAVTFKYSKPGDAMDGSVIDESIIDKFFTFKIGHDNLGSAVAPYFEIIPLSSTLGGSVIVSFKVARFDSRANIGSSNGVFYDYKTVNLSVKIDNSRQEATAGANAVEGGTNSIIPVLDPNSSVNNVYSMAIQDVSSGIDAIASAVLSLSSKTTEEEIKQEFYNAIYDGKQDLGFPSSKKKDTEDLAYLMADADKYFNNRYNFFASDNDFERLTITSKSTASERISYQDKTVIITIGADALGITNNNDEFNKLAFLFGSSSTTSEFNKAFSNKYGLYDMYFNAGTGNLTFKYDVITITAKKSTNSVTYANVGDTQKANISAPVFSAISGGDVLSLNLKEPTSETSFPTNNFRMHAQNSLRLKSGTVTGASSLIYGNTSAASNVLSFSKSVNIGAAAENAFKLSVSDLVADDTNIIFSYDIAGSNTYGNYQAYNSSFDPLLLDMKLSYDHKTLTFDTKAVFNNLYIGINLRRMTLNGPLYLNETDTTEMIRIEISVTSTKLNGDFKIRTGVNSKYVISSGETGISIPVYTTDSQTTRLTVADISKVDIIDINLSNNSSSIAMLTNGNDLLAGNTTTFNFKAVSRGTITVSYKLKRYNEIINDSFTVTVEGVVDVSGAYSVSTETDISLSSIRNDIKEAYAKSTGYGNVVFENLIINKTEKAPDGYYIEMKDDAGGWTNTIDGHVITIEDTFMSKIELLGSAESGGEFIRVYADSIKNNNMSKRQTRIVLQFTQTTAGNEKFYFEAGVVVSTANKAVYQSGTQDLFILEIVYGQNFEGQDITPDSVPVRNTSNNAVTVPFAYIYNQLSSEDKELFKDSYITYIQAPAGYQKYFTYNFDISGKFFTIVPLYPTTINAVDNIQISIIVTGKNNTNYNLTFGVRVSGIKVDLTAAEYGKIFLICLAIVVGVLFIIFIIRMIVYWRRKAIQRRIIKKNQMLIKMRDKVHNKGTVNKTEVVKTRLKMDDPKYAKMFQEMRKDKETETGITLDNSAIAKKVDKKTKNDEKLKDKKKAKAKGGKKSIDELRAELEAKKVAFAQMQVNGVPPTITLDSQSQGNMQMDQAIMDNAQFNGYHADLSREDVERQIHAKLSEDNMLDFETIDPDEN